MNSKLIGETKTQKKAEQAVARQQKLLENWTEITPSERQDILGTYMQNQIAKAIGISPSEIDMQQSTKHLGIDSLIAVKLRNQLRNDWSVELAAVKFLEDFSLFDLAVLLEELIQNAESNGYIPGLELEAKTKEKDLQQVTEISDGDWLEGEI
ncbi:acyl carrier protein [Mastigocoleus testarum]|uniref:Carrier domain-containing protein n=1 Tax=Mastigocoleus testarum BC008 TaxID=371196 RepID=A0A0V7ZVV4_9CYAN|nr:acyl carrier protein [Mastigocoleus testarum]KST68529.1 hypothetical protein BC008_01295 [Mastigocoleus testarum BC008]